MSRGKGKEKQTEEEEGEGQSKGGRVRWRLIRTRLWIIRLASQGPSLFAVGLIWYQAQLTGT